MPSCLENKNSSFNRVTLQVRIHKIKSFPFRRVWLSASLTVEATLVLSLFVFAVVTMLTPLKIMNHQRRIQASLESAGEGISQYAYLAYLQKRGREAYMREGSSVDFCVFRALDPETYVLSKVVKYRDQGIISHVSVSSSGILEDGETIELIVDYSMRLPFPVFRLKEIPMQAISRRRAWIGIEEGLGENGGGGQENVIVYVGKGSTRYHRSETCHYLHNQLISYPVEKIKSVKNVVNRKYCPCSVCGELVGDRDFVFVMPYGTSYHSRANCTSIMAYVSAVPLHSVEYLGACSYCSGKGGKGQ